VSVVLLHPIGLDGDSWQFLTDPRLADAVRYTLLWHGGRERPPTELSLASLADDVLDANPGEVDLVGLSLGGAVALTAAVRRPERVRSLLLGCSGVGGHGDVLRKRASEVARVGMAGIVESTLARWFTDEVFRSEGHAGVSYARDRLLSHCPESFAAGWRALADLDLFDALPAISARTTVLHADQDVTGSKESRMAIARQIPYSRFATVPGPHMVQLENPDGFQAALFDHLGLAR
jgi:pimeloyl-ACP methyl ester carboxylesterase